MAHRTALIAAGSIAVVIVAGAVAVGANLGILDAADSHPVGKLSASTSVPAAAAQPVAPAVEAPAVEATAAPAQEYLIKKAGTVSITLAKSGLRLTDVTTRPGWKWALAQTTDSRLMVTLRSHSITYKFVAVLGRHRTIVARVDQPVTKVVRSAAPATVVFAAVAPTTASASRAAHGGDGGHSGDGHGGDHADD